MTLLVLEQIAIGQAGEVHIAHSETSACVEGEQQSVQDKHVSLVPVAIMNIHMQNYKLQSCKQRLTAVLQCTHEH